MEKNNFDKLVKAVTESILDKIDYKTNSKINDNSCLILVPNITLGLEDYFEYIKENYPNYEFYIGSSEEFSKMHYIENNKDLKFVEYDVKSTEFINILDEVKTIIILGLKITQMRSLSETEDSDDINHIILSGVMANKSLNIIINANEFMFNKIINVVQEVRNIGINVTNIKQLNKTALNNNYLITERYVENLNKNGLSVLHLNKEQLITPLAKDKLRELKIGIEYNKEDKK